MDCYAVYLSVHMSKLRALNVINKAMLFPNRKSVKVINVKCVINYCAHAQYQVLPDFMTGINSRRLWVTERPSEKWASRTETSASIFNQV